MRTMPDALKASLRSGAKPIVIADFEISIWVRITVTDYSAAFRALISIEVDDADGTTAHSWTEGVQDGWTRGSSNEDCAASFAAAVAKRFELFQYDEIPFKAVYGGGADVFIVFKRAATNGAINVGTGIASSGLQGGSLLLCSGDVPFGGSFPVISEARSIAEELDAVTRESSASYVELTLHAGGPLDFLLQFVPLRNTPVTLYLGSSDVSWPDDWMKISRYRVKDYPRGGSGELVLSLSTALDSANDVFGLEEYLWLNVRPLSRLYQVMSTIAPDLVSSSLDSSLDAETSHFAISRGNMGLATGANTAVSESEPLNSPLEFYSDLFSTTDIPRQSLFATINQFATFLRGCFRSDENGRIEYIPFSQSAAAARSLDAITEISGLEQQTVDENRINFVRVTTASQYTWEEKDRESISMIGRQMDTVIDLPWVWGLFGWAFSHRVGIVDSFLIRSADDSTPTQSIAPWSLVGGICGSAWEVDGDDRVPSAFAPPANHRLSDDSGLSGRYTFLALGAGLHYDLFDHGAETEEIVACGTFSYQYPFSGATQDYYFPHAAYLFDLNLWSAKRWSILNGFYSRLWFATVPPEFGAFDSSSRAGFGSITGAHFTYPDVDRRPRLGFAQDLTIPIHVTRSILNRFKNGAPVVSFRLDIIHADLQIGDVVSIVNDDTIRVGFMNGADASATWEVTSVEIECGDQFGVEVELTLLKQQYTYGYPVFEPIDTPVYPAVDPPSDSVIAESDNVQAGADEVIVFS